MMGVEDLSILVLLNADKNESINYLVSLRGLPPTSSSFLNIMSGRHEVGLTTNRRVASNLSM